MTDWSDERKAMLEEEEKRLRLKAANLQERHGAWSLMAKQELVVADDIRSALDEIERLESLQVATERERDDARAEVADWKRKAYNEAKGNFCIFAEENERLRGLLTEWIPRHSAACCTPDPGSGMFPPGPFLPKWCKCDDLSKRSRAALRGGGE